MRAGWPNYTGRLRNASPQRYSSNTYHQRLGGFVINTDSSYYSTKHNEKYKIEESWVLCMYIYIIVSVS